MSATDENVLVAALGHELRGDDLAGPAVIRRLAATASEPWIELRELRAGPLELLASWRAPRATVVVDAINGDGRPGSWRRFDLAEGSPRAQLRGCASTHAVGLIETVELARELGILPARVVVIGIEGARFELGTGLSRQLRAALPALAEAVLEQARALRRNTDTATPRHGLNGTPRLV